MLSTHISRFGDRGGSNTEKKAAANVEKVLAPYSTIYDENGNEEAFCLLCFFERTSPARASLMIGWNRRGR